MTNTHPKHESISHEDVIAIIVTDDRLVFTLHNRATLTIPCADLSLEHYYTEIKARTDILLSDDWHEITWPQVDVCLRVNDLLRQWLIQPSLSIENLISSVKKYVSPDE